MISTGGTQPKATPTGESGLVDQVSPVAVARLHEMPPRPPIILPTLPSAFQAVYGLSLGLPALGTADGRPDAAGDGSARERSISAFAAHVEYNAAVLCLCGRSGWCRKVGTIHPSWGQLRTHLPPKRASRGPGDGARERSSLYHWVVTCQCSMPAKSYLAGDLTSRDLKTAEDLAEKSDSVSPISFPKRRAFGTSDLCYCPKRTCRLGKSFARETFGDPGRSFARPVVSGIEPP